MFKIKITILSFFLLFGFGFLKARSLNGSYTINPSGSGYKNYASFTKAVKALSDSGISGPVVFNVSDGTYKERITIDAIMGSSAKNTVIFQSNSLDSSKVTIDSISSGTYQSPGYVLGFDGCSYITFRKMTMSNIFKAQLYTYGHVVFLTNSASHINIENCRLLSNYSGTIINFGSAIKNADTSAESYITIKNNYIHGGYYAIQLLASGSAVETGNSVVNNNITAFSSGGMLIETQDSFLISKNIIFTTAQYSSGLSIYGTQNNGQDTSRVINNFMSLPNGTYGLYLQDNNFIDVCNNSVYVNYVSSSAAYFFGTSGTNVRVFNNIFCNDSDGYSVYVATGAVGAMDYNNYYTDGSSFGYLDASPFSRISLWQNTIGMDKNSNVGKPYFKSVNKGDLHLTAKSLYDIHRGKRLASVVDDIDGAPRSALPSKGADDVPLIGNDAMLYSIDSPVIGFCSGTKAVYIRLGNVGNTTITNATINWGINGIARSSVNWKGSLKSGSYVLIKLDTVTFAAGNLLTIYAASHNPNGIVDSFPANDSTNVQIAASMSGTFTIGGTSPDFKTIRAATNVLSKAGVCGPVTFNIRDGKYKETIYLSGIRGASELNTITFQSQSLDSSKVTIDTSWGSSYLPIYCLTLDGASYFIFNKLSFGYTADNCGVTVKMINKSIRNIFSNNHITGINGNNDFGISIQDGNNNLIVNNYFTKSLYGVYLINLNSIPWGNIIRGNTFYASPYAIYSQNSDSLVIRGNKIINSMYYGICITFDSTLQLRDTFFIDNNFIYSQGECIYAQARKTAIRFNTMYSESNYLTMEFTNVSIKASSDILNNIIFNHGAGSGLSINGSNIHSDYNDLVVDAGYYIAMSSIFGNAYDLKSWRKVSGMDVHSVSVNPVFTNFSKGDLHIKNVSSAVARKGNFLPNYSFDFDHQRRPHKACDIGADQFSFDNNDIGITAILYPGSKKCEDSINSVPIQISNLGLKPESGFKVYLSVTGPDTVTASYTYSNTLKVAMDTVILMPLPHKLNTMGNGYYNFTAITSLANDTDRTSDTSMARYSFRDGLIANSIFRSPSCAGDITFLYDSSRGNPKSFQWNFGDGFSSTKMNPLHVFVHPGKYVVSLKIRNSNGCTDSGAKIVTVDSADARYTYAINKSSVDFTPNISGMKYYRWDYGDGSPVDTTAKASHIFSTKGKYRVTLRLINHGGCMATYSDSVNILFTDVNEEIKEVFNFSVYPNPFSDVTNIAYSLDKATHMSIEVYDVWGRRVATLLNNEQASGEYTFKFNPLDYNIGTAGILILKINAGTYSSRKTLILAH